MTFYYLINQYNRYSGYTTNEFIFRKYLRQLEDLMTEPKFQEYCYCNTIECRNESDLYAKLQYSVTGKNELYTIHDEYSDNILVINRDIYDRFVSEFVNGRELFKYYNKIYKAIRPQTIALLYDKFNNDVINDIVPILIRVNEIFNEVREEISQFSNNSEVFEKVANYSYAPLWNYFNEYEILKEYLKVDLYRFFYTQLIHCMDLA